MTDRINIADYPALNAARNRSTGLGFWLPESAREDEFYAPRPSEMHNIWASEYLDASPAALNFLELDETVLNACVAPDKQPTHILSMDLCEVLRLTGNSLTGVNSPEISQVPSHENGQRPNYDQIFAGDPNVRHMVDVFVQELTKAGSVPPVPHHDFIASTLRILRQNDVYIVANTSMVEGTEVGTAQMLKTYYPDCFDGILFPRNHTASREAMTKGRSVLSLQRAITNFTDFDGDVPVTIVEDSPAHVNEMLESVTSDFSAFVPEYPWNENIPDVSNVDRVPRRKQGDVIKGPARAVIKASNHILSRLNDL